MAFKLSKVNLKRGQMSEQKVDNTLRTINKHLQDLYNILGGRSEEYELAQQQIMSKVRTSLIDMPEYDGKTMIKPMRLKRSKQAIAEFTRLSKELQDIREWQKNEGTAKKQSQKYINDLKQQGITPTKEKIKQIAERLNMGFEEVYRLVGESDKIPEFEKISFYRRCSTINAQGYDKLFECRKDGIDLLQKYGDLYEDTLPNEEDVTPNAQQFDMNQL